MNDRVNVLGVGISPINIQESFDGVHMEAWSFGKPVIGYNIPAVSEVISEGIDGYLVEQEPAQIAERICHLLLNPEMARVMGEKGRQKVVARYIYMVESSGAN